MADGKKYRHTGIKGELIRLLCQLPCDGADPQMGGCPDRRHGVCREVDKLDYCAVQAFADHLIANGVTIQKWIPVTERLPEDNSNVIACLWIGEESRIYPAFYAHGVWWDRVFSTPTTNTTTHWMPLPEPPKEVSP